MFAFYQLREPFWNIEMLDWRQLISDRQTDTTVYTISKLYRPNVHTEIDGGLVCDHGR